ncbi:MAG: EAL domain-containing protein [Gammaproteobacteria bacterium]
MRLRPLNLLTGLVFAIVLLGVISAVAVFLSAQNYRRLAIDFQRGHMTQQVSEQAANILADELRAARRLALLVQSQERFNQALASSAADSIAAVLRDQFAQQLVTSEIVNAVGLYAFDPEYNLLGGAARLDSVIDSGVVLCPGFTGRGQQRVGPEQHLPLSGICLHAGRPLFAAMIPMDGLSPTGFLQVIADPVFKLGKIDSQLDMRIRISRMDGVVLYTSPAGPVVDPDTVIKTEYVLHTGDDQPALLITATRAADKLVTRLDSSNKRLLPVVGLTILATMALALLLVKYSVFQPLRKLSRQLREEWSGSRDRVAGHAPADSEDEPVSFHALGELYESLHDKAIRDPLTGIYNRALLEDRLKQIIAEHRRSPGTAAILLVDMVRFKYVNDLLGHYAGDQVLKEVVERIGAVLRESDTLARLGGDEFVVILPDTDDDQAIQVAQKIIQSMNPDFVVEGHTLSAAVSIGIAMLPEHGEDVETLLRHADYAMYSMKSRRDGYAFYDPMTTDEANVARMALHGMLNEDIERNDLFLVYHPVMDFATGRVAYLEALVRWRQADGRILMPDTFIRVAEQSGLIRQLSGWVIDTACRELAELQQTSPGLRTGVNLSMHNLHDLGLTDKIRGALERNHLQPRSLLLEITETGFMLDPDQVIVILDQLAALGLQLSIDDFGTGHSSLVYLKRLPVNTLKVDKSFVADMDTDDDNASIVRATIDLAHSLGLTVTAEGVESRPVLDLLTAMGCDYYQGFYVAEPMDKAAVTAWLSGNHAVMQSQ